jgi:transcription termination factor Rho
MTTTLENRPVQQQSPARTASGVLDIDASGKGHLRAENCLPSPADAAVSPALIRRYGLRKGDLVEGVRGDRHGLSDVVRIDGRTPGHPRDRRHFRDLTPLHPHERLRLEHPAAGRPDASST